MKDTARCWAEIDTAAVRANLNYCKSLIGQARVMPIIKGDAHGHGAVALARIYEAEGVYGFGVACLSEALELRSEGITSPILILGWTDEAYVSEMIDAHVAQSAYDEAYAAALNAAAAECGGVLDVHIKLDTGMSRTGLLAQSDPVAAAEAAARIDRMENLRVVGIFTHFAAADMPQRDDFTALQLEKYNRTLAELDRLGACRGAIRHAANSAGIMYHPETHFDVVRMGVMMYGLYPDGVSPEGGPLTPVLTLKAHVAQVKEVPSGALVSYGCTFETKRATKLAIVSAGYADSYPRAMSNKGAYAVINGQKCPQVGRICMDMCMFDVTDADVHRGDEVILYGQGGMPLEEVAALANTINCGPTCLLTARVKKVYV